MLQRHSSRRDGLYQSFLKPRLAGATRYDRIAGYFQSGLLELASAELKSIRTIRIVCNTEVSPEDVKAVRMATGPRREELQAGLGTANSLWRKVDGPALFDIVAGREDVADLHEKWLYWRDPLPSPLDADSGVFDWVRHDLGLAATACVASVSDQDRIDDARGFELEILSLRDLNPFTQWVIKRSRERLEAEGKLVKVEMVPHGDGQPILCSHSMEQAMDLAEDFAKALHQRVKAGGFIKTLLQRRVGSSLLAGLKTTEKMLVGRTPDFIVDEWVTDMLEDRAWDDDTILTVIAERKQNPFTVKETTESLEADWDATAEILNGNVAYRRLLDAW